MSTTTLFAELLIIGLQAVLWIFLLICAAFGSKCFEHVATAFKEAGGPATIGVIAFAYVTGVILDEFYELLIDKCRGKLSKSRMREMFIMADHVSVHSNTGTARLEYIRGRIRIVRSSVFNLSLIVVFTLVLLYTRVESTTPWRTGAISLVIVGGLITVPVTLLVYRRLEDSYRKRAKNFYDSLKSVT